MAAAAGGGGGGANIQPNILAVGMLKGARLIRSNLVSQQNAKSWFDKYRQEKQNNKGIRIQNGIDKVDSLWSNALGQEELGLRYDKFLAGTFVSQLGYTKEDFSANGTIPGGAMLIHTVSPRQFIQNLLMNQIMTLEGELYKPGAAPTQANKKTILDQTRQWIKQISPVFYAHIAYALTEPLTAEEEENLRRIYGRNGQFDDSRAEFQRIISSLDPQNGGGKRRTSKRRATQKKRRT
jgi:hypothetical protein